MYLMKVIEVADFKYEVRFDLRGCLEAVVASEAAKRAHTTLCTWISRYFKSEVRFDLRGCLEAVVALESSK